jgi:hypothetical protein
LLADRLGAEPGVGGEAVQLAHDIRALMGEMELGPKAGHYVKGLLEKVKTEISAIQVAKRRLVETWFHQPIYGVPLSDSVLELDCVTSKLYQAYGIAQQARQHTFAGSARDLVVPLMEAAKRCKEHLEAEFRGVPAGGQQTTSTSNTGTSTSTSTTTGTQSTSTTTTTTGGQGTPPPVSHFCQTPPLPCAAWVQGSDLYETGLAINDELTNFNMALPSGTVITSVTGGCAFSGNDISCPAVNGYESIIITTKQQLQPIAHATLTYYYAQSPPATYSISLTNCSQTSCP